MLPQLKHRSFLVYIFTTGHFLPSRLLSGRHWGPHILLVKIVDEDVQGGQEDGASACHGHNGGRAVGG
jgi:hypothetical protein